uniref:Uncharacterized protein n=1 Tax=Rhizophora mucronata TaxID=61149 RepID=A0A2P2QN36_RHIMU
MTNSGHSNTKRSFWFSQVQKQIFVISVALKTLLHYHAETIVSFTT